MRAQLLALALALVPVAGSANDGRDRHRHHGPNVLYLFPDPVSPAAGYRVLPADAPGGADGDRAFRWAQRHAVALVRVAAFDAQRALGAAAAPLAIFDAAAENGDTPIGRDARGVPRGRHPGGSHDGGLNLDLGYQLTSLVGRHFTPDHAACTEHFVAAEGSRSAVEDAYQCRGPADRLDVPRQALFMLRLVQLDEQHFERRLIENIGIDREARDPVLAQVLRWARGRVHRATQRQYEDLRRACTADRWEGWAGSHHHHLHLRLRDLPLAGALAAGEQRLLERERQIDLQLLGGRGRALRARLLSVGLERAIELELLGAGAVRDVRFTVAGAGTSDADPADYAGRRAVIDLPGGLQRAEQARQVAAWLVLDDEGPQRLSAELLLPRLEPHLAVAIDPARLRTAVRRAGGAWQLEVAMPAVYRTLVTGAEFRVHRAGALQLLPGLDQGPRFVATLPAGELPLVEAVVVASGRQRIAVPARCAAVGTRAE